MPYSLTYSSTACFVLSETEVGILLGRARELNAAADVTGLLVYLLWGDDRAGFVQVLEGEQDAVEETYARICRDELHRDLTVVQRGAVAGRRFSGWSMKFTRLQHQEMPQVTPGRTVAEDMGDPLTDPAAALRVIAADGDPHSDTGV
ncbi:BLUF domain-containing protein [Nocardia sp. NPDC005978]|uniref:BLUF domain-containing protein n=1 Tax=unclassified Nocardia TaxID=2637762 RepID=UPI0033BCE84D